MPLLDRLSCSFYAALTGLSASPWVGETWLQRAGDRDAPWALSITDFDLRRIPPRGIRS
jgi:hypothetical protein